VAFYARLLERLREASGVDLAASVSVLPFSGADTDTRFLIEGRPVPELRGEWPSAWNRQITPDYFRVLRIPVVRGRSFNDADRAGAPAVAIVNETLARRYWPGEDPIGRRIRTGDTPNTPWITIVGIIGDVRHRGLDEGPEPELYLSQWQYAVPFQTIVLRADGRESAAIVALRAAVRSIDPDIPVSQVVRLDDLLDRSVRQPRSLATLLTAFSVAALALAALGVYGLMAYSVSLRSTELAVRMALGAERSAIAGLVARESALLASAGLVVGVVLSTVAGRVLASQLFGVTAYDPQSLATAIAALVVATAIACIVPVRRATRLETMRLLKG
jgi:putative ABC transport system permease protein